MRPDDLPEQEVPLPISRIERGEDGAEDDMS